MEEILKTRRFNKNVPVNDFCCLLHLCLSARSGLKLAGEAGCFARRKKKETNTQSTFYLEYRKDSVSVKRYYET